MGSKAALSTAVFTKDRLRVGFVVFGFCFCFSVVFLFALLCSTMRCLAKVRNLVSDQNSKPDRPVPFLFVFFALTMRHSLWDLRSPTRDRTQALGSESTES